MERQARGRGARDRLHEGSDPRGGRGRAPRGLLAGVAHRRHQRDERAGATRAPPNPDERSLAQEVLRLQRSAGNAAVASLFRQPAPPPTKPKPLLTPTEAKAAAKALTKRYDPDSVRVLEALIGLQPPDGAISEAEAEALAAARKTKGMSPKAVVDEALLDLFLSSVGPREALRDALVHLVVNHAKLDVSSVISVRYDAGTLGSMLNVGPLGVGTILLGNDSFKSYKTMVGEIKKQLAAASKAGPKKATAVPAGVLSAAKDQEAAVKFDAAKLSDARSIRIVQGLAGGVPNGKWDAETVRHVAAKQQALGKGADGKIDEATLEAFVNELLASFEQEAVLQLIVDWYDLDRSHAYTLAYDQTFVATTADEGSAETQRPFTAFGTGGIVKFGPAVFTKGFAGLVHTVAHELGHIDQTFQGIQSDDVREFLSESVELVSSGMPTESMESLADIDALTAGKRPADPGFLDDAVSALGHWLAMSAAEQKANSARFVQVRGIVLGRIAREATAAQQARLKKFVERWKAAPDGT